MANRQNFADLQRLAAYRHNALWLKDHSIDGILIAAAYEQLRQAGLIYYCENCLFCHTDQQFFDVDHLVPDRHFKLWGKHPQARATENMIILCKSLQRGDLGCNQSKSSSLYVPRHRGLAFSRSGLDMNCYPLADRPFRWT
jgi:hypothetical protein